ncbi:MULTISPECIES: hypothetical protein [Brevundimonas]|uniref:hypothetical protein n=1 Tax=Brevundimonas TaxID=41275 RepID=UPI0012DEF885|nr:hypothetical protein [Brevundimonas naejangsanensis]
MRSIVKLAAAGLLFAMTASPAVAFKAPEYVYYYTFYSDASKTTIVGYGQDYCMEYGGNAWVVTPLFPTPYYTAERGHECRPGGPL